MSNFKCTALPLAIRVYPESGEKETKPRSNRIWRLPEAMFVFDTETRTDAPQKLTFGSGRFLINGRCVEEILFHGDDLPEKDRHILERYVASYSADVVPEGIQKLRLLTRSELVEKLFRHGYKDRCLIVGFNFPFDLSRIAFSSTTARGNFAGGFSFVLATYTDENGLELPDNHRPRVTIKHINNKSALKSFTARNKPDKIDLIPEGSTTGKSEKGYKFRGHLLDLRTLAFALTDIGYKLESACKAFGVTNGKQKVAKHGIVSDDYIDYNRRDVLATSELAVKLLEAYAKHPILLQATKAFSPASIGKSYLRAMGIKPILERQPKFPKEYLGFAQSAFFGGRASAHIRKVPVPVVHTDFLSMYPTVNSLMSLWRFVTANKIKVVEHCQDEIYTFLNTLKANDLFKPETWKHLPAFVKIVPDCDILPTRGKYSEETNDWQVAVSNLYSDSNEGLWFTLPDVVASVILTGRVPRIVDAFRIEPHGTIVRLQPTKLLGAIEVDPAMQDFFKVVIEQRKLLSFRTDLSDADKKRLDKALKVLANAASYGIYAEMNRHESDEKVQVTCHGIEPEPFSCIVQHPEKPGAYCFPPLASLITGAARLMLALLEHCVTELGGTYAMEDTDSMAIVATEDGGMIDCPGGPYRTKANRPAVKALSWNQVREIVERFELLNPYDRSAVPGSILKIEDDNFDLKTGEQRQLYCLAISAKRYVLFLKDKKGIPALLRKDINNKTDHWSRHGLGHLLNPSDPESDDQQWIALVWLNIVRRALGLKTKPLPFEPLPAVGKLSVSSPAVMRAFASLNGGKPYADQIKPFNFGITCHVGPFGHPVEADPERFHLIAPYDPDSRNWLKIDWIDQYSGKTHRVTTTDHHANRNTARVKTYGDVLSEYEYHAESKCADANGIPSDKQTLGLLQRRHVRIERIVYVGKESNGLEAVEAGMIHDAQSVYTEYPDPKRDEWETIIRTALQKISLSVLQKESGLSRRTLIDVRTGKRKPHLRNQKLLAGIVRKLN